MGCVGIARALWYAGPMGADARILAAIALGAGLPTPPPRSARVS